jgi:hypothetical protein
MGSSRVHLGSKEHTQGGRLNLGSPNAGSITAALFLEEHRRHRPGRTITRWIPNGPTAFGFRLLAELAVHFDALT